MDSEESSPSMTAENADVKTVNIDQVHFLASGEAWNGSSVAVFWNGSSPSHWSVSLLSRSSDNCVDYWRGRVDDQGAGLKSFSS